MEARSQLRHRPTGNTFYYNMRARRNGLTGAFAVAYNEKMRFRRHVVAVILVCALPIGFLIVPGAPAVDRAQGLEHRAAAAGGGPGSAARSAFPAIPGGPRFQRHGRHGAGAGHARKRARSPSTRTSAPTFSFASRPTSASSGCTRWSATRPSTWLRMAPDSNSTFRPATRLSRATTRSSSVRRTRSRICARSISSTPCMVRPVDPAADKVVFENFTDEDVAFYIMHVVHEDKGELRLERSIWFSRVNLEIARQVHFRRRGQHPDRCALFRVENLRQSGFPQAHRDQPPAGRVWRGDRHRENGHQQGRDR